MNNEETKGHNRWLIIPVGLQERALQIYVICREIFLWVLGTKLGFQQLSEKRNSTLDMGVRGGSAEVGAGDGGGGGNSLKGLQRVKKKSQECWAAV